MKVKNYREARREGVSSGLLMSQSIISKAREFVEVNVLGIDESSPLPKMHPTYFKFLKALLLAKVLFQY